MGISGLLPLLKEIQVNGNISEFRGKRLAVDAYVWLHKGAFGCAEDLVKGKKITRFVDYAMYRVRLLRHHGITPFIVFDGGPLPAKKGTEVSRAKSRAENLAKAKALEGQGRHKDARDFYTKCVDITPEMAFQLIKALRAEGVDYIVAPYEADAQLCYLEREGYVDGIITEDSDLLVFGCKQVIFKLDSDGNCIHIHRDKIAQINGFPMHGWTNTQFRRMAMLSGCDYLPSIPGIGIKTAHKLLRRFNTVEKLLQHLRMEGASKIPTNYVASFNQAELAFLHQRVYDPATRRLTPLGPFPETGLQVEDEKWIGLELEDSIARGVAAGDLHPETFLPIEDQWPDYKPAPRLKAGPTRTTSSTGPLRASGTTNGSVPKGAGPMDAFISRSKKPVLPRPVGVNGSGPSRLSDLVGARTLTPTKRAAPPRSSLNAPGARSAVTPKGVVVAQSKFFGGGTQPARPVREAPSPVGKDEVHLLWEKSSEAGPEVDFDETQQPNRRIEDQTGMDGTVIGGEMRSPSPDVSSLRGDSSPLRNRDRQSTCNRNEDPLDIKGDTGDYARFSSPHAPALSSPPNMSLSPLRPLTPRDDLTPTRVEKREEEMQWSSPPDIGRERSLTADAFSPSPSPRHLPSPKMPTERRASGDMVGDSGTRGQVIIPTTSSSTEGFFSQPNIRHARSALVSMPSAADHGIVPDTQDLGSSDVLTEEDIVTPSLNPRSSVQISGSARRGGKRSATDLLHGHEVEVEVDGERDDIEVHSDIDTDDDGEDAQLRRWAAEKEAERAKREQRAQVVALGWKERYALKPMNGSVTPRTPCEPLIKRRRTDPSPIRQVGKGVGPLGKAITSTSTSGFPRMGLSPLAPLSVNRSASHVDAKLGIPGEIKPTTKKTIMTNAKTPQAQPRPAAKSRASLPLSACAPRFGILDDDARARANPKSNANIAPSSASRVDRYPAIGGDTCDTPSRGRERDGSGVLARFKFAGGLVASQSQSAGGVI